MQNLRDILDQAGADYTLHNVPVGTGKSVEEHIKAFGLEFSDGCSTLVFSADNEFVALLRRDDCRIDSKAFKKALGAKSLRLATPEELDRETGFAPGMASPIGLKIPIYVDEYVLQKESVRVGTGSNEFSLEISVNDLQKVTKAKTVSVCTLDEHKASNRKPRILTGERPTGPLHIGHYLGSLQSRVDLQDEYETYVILADVQALTDNFDNPEKVSSNVLEVYKDNLAVGIDPSKTKVFVQSMIPQIAELTVLFMNLVSLNEVMRNPTVKTEIQQKNFGESVPFGFVGYPVSQAADILFVKGDLVPVGEDQLPMIELAARIARKFNRTYGQEIFPEPKAKLGEVRRLPGTDGNAKMGKSLGNVINLKDSQEQLKKKIMGMYTDPNRIHATDPGKVEGNPVFIYHDAFNDDTEQVADLKQRYQKGTVGDVEVKQLLFEAMDNKLTPIREHRNKLDSMDQKKLMGHLLDSTREVLKEAEQTMQQVRAAMRIDYT